MSIKLLSYDYKYVKNDLNFSLRVLSNVLNIDKLAFFFCSELSGNLKK